MFTGLVEKTCVVQALTPRDGGARLSIDVGADWVQQLSLGESVAVNGCCLTVTDKSHNIAAFDLLEQTLRVTNLGRLQTNRKVNLERALAVGARLGGHFVQGHVDATVEILFWDRDGADYRLDVALPPGSKGLVIPKGSICLDGISLTAAHVTAEIVTCWIIPHTHEVTHLHTCRAGDKMNVEWDMLGKYVRALVATPE
jgi:riboflavin synthase